MDILSFPVPQLVQLLSALNNDLTPVCDPEHHLHLENTVSRRNAVRNLLDAFAFFLHNEPECSTSFAITLTPTEYDIIVALAISSSSDLDSLSSSSQRSLQTIWQLMQKCRQASAREQADQDFAQFLLRNHFPILVHRLNKWRSQYEKCRETAYRIIAADGHSAFQIFFGAADKVYAAVCTFCKQPINEKTIAEFLDIRSSCTTLSKVCSKSYWEPHEYIIEVLSELPGEAGIEDVKFNLTHYMNKLCLPLAHLTSIFEFCHEEKNHRFLVRSLQIKVIASPPLDVNIPSFPQSWSTEDSIGDFIQSNYGGSGFGYIDRELPSASAALAKTIAHNMQRGKFRPIGRTHPECILAQYHFTHPHAVAPLRYIASSKVPCFQCALFLAAYHDYCEYVQPGSGPVFRIGRSSAVVRPFVLPTLGEAADEFISGNMKYAVKRALKIIVNARVSEQLNAKERGILPL